MKYMRIDSMFFTSKFFMFFHLIQNILFWMVVIVFPIISVIGCNGGHKWMSHVAMALYLGLFMIFDFVFLAQYIGKESSKFDLRAFNKGSYRKNGKFCFMVLVFFEAIFELLMT